MVKHWTQRNDRYARSRRDRDPRHVKRLAFILQDRDGPCPVSLLSAGCEGRLTRRGFRAFTIACDGDPSHLFRKEDLFYLRWPLRFEVVEWADHPYRRDPGSVAEAIAPACAEGCGKDYWAHPDPPVLLRQGVPTEAMKDREAAAAARRAE